MKYSFFISAKRNISLIIIILLATVCCGNYDSRNTTFHSKGSISACNRTAAHTLIACTPGTAREDSGSSNGHEQNLEKTIFSSNNLSRIVRKLMVLLGWNHSSESVTKLRLYFLSICISTYAYLFLLTLIRFIHLIDGNK